MSPSQPPQTCTQKSISVSASSFFVSASICALVLTYLTASLIPLGKDPEVICASSEYKELKWIAGEYYWMESVQSYNNDGWDYLTELRTFVDKGMTDQSFIDGVSGIVSRGCHNPVSIH